MFYAGMIYMKRAVLVKLYKALKRRLSDEDIKLIKSINPELLNVSETHELYINLNAKLELISDILTEQNIGGKTCLKEHRS